MSWLKLKINHHKNEINAKFPIKWLILYLFCSLINIQCFDWNVMFTIWKLTKCEIFHTMSNLFCSFNNWMCSLMNIQWFEYNFTLIISKHRYKITWILQTVSSFWLIFLTCSKMHLVITLNSNNVRKPYGVIIH